MKKHKLWLGLTAFAIPAFVALCAAALPMVQSASDTDDDATITLRTLNQTIDGDAKSWCEVRLNVGESDVEFTAGDPVFVWVYEDDTAGDDLIWSFDTTVTSQEASAGRFDRTWDCSGFFDSDTGSQLELYAEARVEKDECGTFCAWDRPQTANLDIDVVTDDNREENDTSNAATGAALGANNDFIARDQDWFRLSLSSPSRVMLELNYRTNVGTLDMTFYDTGLNPRGAVVDNANGGTLTIDRVEAGDYVFRVSPRISNDFNFYDVRMTIDTLAADCVVNSTEDRTCGRCGTETRTCDANGRWGPYGECSGEGVCATGEQMTESCGNCGTSTITCTDQCQWGDPSACAGEGECPADSTEEVPCANGTMSRTCASDCVWGDFTACGQVICNDGESEDCYNGPEGTAGTGLCRAGRRACVNNAWGECRGETLPAAEVCADTRDNDCDGQTDAADTDCAVPGRPLGDPCGNDDECTGDLDCVRGPQDPQFEGGYCGKAECASDADCGDEGFCSTIFDENYCLLTCANSGECRDGYICVSVGGRMGCAPRCRADNHCRGTDLPICNPDTGLCEAVGDNNGNNNPNNANPNNNTPNNANPNNANPNNANPNNSDPNNSAGNNTGTNAGTNGETPPPAATGEEACGCTTPARTPALPFALLIGALGLVGAVALRRR